MAETKTIRLTGSQVCQLVAEYVAKTQGLKMPVAHVGRWLMREGCIELELDLELTVESVDNVRKLETVRLVKR